MDTKHLTVPRLLYKGPDDSNVVAIDPEGKPLDKAIAEVQETARLKREEHERLEQKTQTKRVESHTELDAALKDGWRLQRAIDKTETAAATENRAEAAEVVAEAGGGSVEAAATAHDAKTAKKK